MCGGFFWWFYSAFLADVVSIFAMPVSHSYVFFICLSAQMFVQLFELVAFKISSCKKFTYIPFSDILVRTMCPFLWFGFHFLDGTFFEIKVES